MAVLDPLRFWINTDASEAEIRMLWERQRVVDAIAAGELEPEAIADLLLTQGENPDEYLEQATESLEHACTQEIDPEEALIYVPGSE